MKTSELKIKWCGYDLLITYPRINDGLVLSPIIVQQLDAESIENGQAANILKCATGVSDIQVQILH